MSRILRNSVLNGAALGVTSLLSLFLIPVLIGHYGLEAYGLIPLLRLLTPLGAMGIATLGLPQFATRAAALHAARGEQDELQRSQSALIALSVAVGAVVAAVMLGIGAARLGAWLNVGEGESAAFATGFHAVALLMPLLITGFVLSASLTGLGSFRALRTIEVTIYLLYFSVCMAAVLAALPVIYLIIALLVADALRSICLFLYARRISLIRTRFILAPDLRWLAGQRQDFLVITNFSLLGYARKHVTAASLAVLFGPSALGVYDAVERVPRALKSVLGLVTTSMLPRAMRLDASADDAGLHSLLMRGTRLTLLFTLPLAATVMLYAAPIVSTWLGQRFDYAGTYLLLLMVPFVLDSSLSLVTTATLSRVRLISHQNGVAVVEILVLLVVLALLLPLAGQTAPYAASAAAAFAGYSLRLRVFLPAYRISGSQWLALVGKVAVGSAFGCASVFIIVRLSVVAPALALASAPLAVLSGFAAIVLLWNSQERADLATVLASLRSMLSLRASR